MNQLRCEWLERPFQFSRGEQTRVHRFPHGTAVPTLGRPHRWADDVLEIPDPSYDRQVGQDVLLATRERDVQVTSIFSSLDARVDGDKVWLTQMYVNSFPPPTS